ncbi:hypothetical protein WMY93_033575 [Mugilogobius chulae]|uniref:Uncharacterized protein n=1 Tax=Mugilogobius chulae TaxID=88201 RepID=A0AAW0MSE8_9GOBI
MLLIEPESVRATVLFRASSRPGDPKRVSVPRTALTGKRHRSAGLGSRSLPGSAFSTEASHRGSGEPLFTGLCLTHGGVAPRVWRAALYRALPLPRSGFLETLPFVFRMKQPDTFGFCHLPTVDSLEVSSTQTKQPVKIISSGTTLSVASQHSSFKLNLLDMSTGLTLRRLSSSKDKGREESAAEVPTSLSSCHEPTQASVTVTGLDSLEVSSTQTKQPVKIISSAPHSQWRLSTAALSSTFCHFTGPQQLKLQ